MARFENKKWEITVIRNMSLFQSCMDVGGHYLHSKNFGLPKYEHLFVVKDGMRMHAYDNRKNSIKYLKKVEKICLDPAKFKKLKALYKKYGDALLKASDDLEENPGSGEYKRYIRANFDLSAGLYITTAIGRHMHDLLSAKLKLLFPNIDENKIQTLISEITYPGRFTPLSQSRLDLLELCIYLQKNKIRPAEIKKFPHAEKIFKRYYAKYHFIPVNFNEDPWTREDIVDQIKAIYRHDCRREKENILRSHRSKTRLMEKRLREIKNQEVLKIAKVLQEGTVLNEYRKYVFCRASLAYRPLFKKIAEENGMKSWKDCWKLTPDEIYRLRFEGDKKTARAARSRNWAGIIYSISRPGYKIVAKEAIKAFIGEIEHTKPESNIKVTNELKGMIANKGKITGIVKIILGKKDFVKFKEGDIIVAVMTSVDFVPIMERAGAFVTNEGGITSHASIVSRELNKPCIIGTKIATRTLKDGDLVEVDADKGAVKILKRKNQ